METSQALIKRLKGDQYLQAENIQIESETSLGLRVNVKVKHPFTQPPRGWQVETINFNKKSIKLFYPYFN